MVESKPFVKLVFFKEQEQSLLYSELGWICPSEVTCLNFSCMHLLFLYFFIILTAIFRLIRLGEVGMKNSCNGTDK